jgi:hypothetical protein
MLTHAHNACARTHAHTHARMRARTHTWLHADLSDDEVTEERESTEADLAELFSFFGKVRRRTPSAYPVGVPHRRTPSAYTVDVPRWRTPSAYTVGVRRQGTPTTLPAYTVGISANRSPAACVCAHWHAYTCA